MDVKYELRGILFCWDAEKERLNIRKHGVAFRQATEVFFDPFLVSEDASRKGEVRDGAVGADFDFQVLFVVHVAFEGDHIRIISARKALPQERRRYEDGND